MADKTETTVQETGVNSQDGGIRKPSIFDDPDAKTFRFHRTESMNFQFGKDGVGSITLYRKYDFMLKITGEDEIDADKVEGEIISAVDHVLGITKAEDVEKYNNFKEIDMNGRPTLVYTVFIPFSERLNLIVQNLTRQIQLFNTKVESDGYQVVIRRKDMVKVSLNTDVGVSDKVFMKGVVAASHENAITNRETEEIIRNAHDNVRGNIYMDASVGLTRKEAFMFNRYNLSLLKFGVYGDDEDEKDHKSVVTFFLPFKKKFFIEEFQIEQNDLGDGKSFKCTRTLTPVLLYMSKIIKMSEFYTPTGIVTIQKKSVIGIDTFDEIFLDENKKNVLISKAEMNESSFEVTTFNTELKTIQDQIFSGIKNVEETVSTEKSEEDSSAKSAKSKKKKSAKSTEEAANEEAEVVPAGEEPDMVQSDVDSGDEEDTSGGIENSVTTEPNDNVMVESDSEEISEEQASED